MGFWMSLVNVTVIAEFIAMSYVAEVMFTVLGVVAVLIVQVRVKVVEAVQVAPLCTVIYVGKVITRQPPALGI